MRVLVCLLIAAGSCWILSEIWEIRSGGRTGFTLGLTAAFHLFMAAGIWGAYFGEFARKSTFSLTAAGIASVGFLILVYPPLAVAQTPSTTITAFMKASPVFGMAGVLATLGTSLFGVAVLRHRSYPVWIGFALTLSPLVFTAVMVTGGPEVLGIAANLFEGSALVAMGGLVLRAMRLPPVPSASRAA